MNQILPVSNSPKYQQVAGQLRQAISRGEFESGKLPTEPRLCQMFGVSLITIRKALSILQTEGVVVKRQGAGSFVKHAHRAPKRQKQKSYLIGYVSGAGSEQLLGSFYYDCFLQAQATANQFGYHLVFCPLNSYTVPAPIEHNRVDATVICGTVWPGANRHTLTSAVVEQNRQFVSRLCASSQAVVTANNYADVPSSFRVEPDIQTALNQLMALASDGGVCRVGYIGADGPWPAFTHRMDAFHAAAAKGDLSVAANGCLHYPSHGGMASAEVDRQIRQYLMGPDLPDLIVVGTGDPWRVLKICREENITVGKDVSLVFISSSPHTRRIAEENFGASVCCLEVSAGAMMAEAISTAVRAVDGTWRKQDNRHQHIPLTLSPGSTSAFSLGVSS